MKITAIERNKKNRDRISVYIDNKFSFTLSEEDYIKLGIYEMSEITDEELEYIKNTLNFRDAKNTALRYISTKLRTEKEVRIKLNEEGFDNDSIESAIAELNALGYINNKIYVQKFVFDRSKLKPKSKKLLKLELKNKGIAEDIIDEVLDDWNVDESIVAEGLVKRKFGKYDLKDEKIKMKMYMFLKHRGYDHELIESVLRNLEE